MLWQEEIREEGFLPFEKVAAKIDNCLSIISYYRHLGRDEEALQKELEVNELRREIQNIKKSLRRKTY